MLIDRLTELGFQVHTPSQAERHAGIISFAHPKMNSADIQEELAEEGVFCALRGGNIRFSPHFYTPQHHLQQTLEWLRSMTES
jgi:selenocysteine lyase/cysteine desulfurase